MSAYSHRLKFRRFTCALGIFPSRSQRSTVVTLTPYIDATSAVPISFTGCSVIVAIVAPKVPEHVSVRGFSRLYASPQSPQPRIAISPHHQAKGRRPNHRRSTALLGRYPE